MAIAKNRNHEHLDDVSDRAEPQLAAANSGEFIIFDLYSNARLLTQFTVEVATLIDSALSPCLTPGISICLS